MNSLWRGEGPPATFPPLSGPIDADVCIAGAGLAGLLTAYHALDAGLRTVILERGQPGSGDTLNTTAHLSFVLDRRYSQLEQMHGRRGAALAMESHRRGMERLAAIARREHFDCGLARIDGYLLGSKEELEREAQFFREHGIDGVTVTDPPVSSFAAEAALRIPGQAEFDPRQFLSGLLAAVVSKGGKVYGGSPAEEFTEKEDGWEIRTGTDGVARARNLVTATHTPVDPELVIHTKQGPYRTYVVAFHIDDGQFPHALYWDTADPYHYVRMAGAPARRLLLAGGEDHKTGQDDDGDERLRCLEQWARTQFPGVGDVAYRWSGQVYEPFDGLAFIGPTGNPNSYVATGFSGNGMTYSAISAMLLTDLIAGKPNEWAEIYNPSRMTLRAAGQYIHNAADMAAQYSAWVTAGEVDDASKIEAGSGAILRDGLRKIAAYRDENGELFCYSAVCPHLEGIVAWNSTEKTWDCPCHGSRFDAFGKVLNGPAVTGLQILPS